MTTTINDDARCSGAVQRRLFLLQSGALLLSACGGGGGDSGEIRSDPVASPAAPDVVLPAASSPPPPPAAAPGATLTIASVSSTTPTPLSPLYVKVTGLDVSRPFTVTLANTSKSSLPIAPLRSQADGTVVLATPVHLDAGTGQTAALPVTLTFTQDGASVSTSIVIGDLPSLADYGVSLGDISRAFWVHQEMALGRNINGQQALSFTSATAAAANASLIARLETQLASVIAARQDVERIVANRALKVLVGPAPDGTVYSFGAESVDMMDRIIARYLLAFTAASATAPARTGTAVALSVALGDARKSPDSLASGLLNGLIQSMNLGNGSVAFSQSQLTAMQASAGDASTTDAVLASMSSTLTIITATLGLVALAATVAAVAVPGAVVLGTIAASAAAVATYSALAGVVVGSVAVVNDMYNVGTDTHDFLMADSGSTDRALALTRLEHASATLATDTFVVVANAAGYGAFSKVASLESVKLGGNLFQAILNDAMLGSSTMLASTANLRYQGHFDEDLKTAGDVAALATRSTFGTVIGMADVINPQATTTAALTAITIGPAGSVPGLVTTIAAPDGSYSLEVPLGVAGIDYSALTLTAFDPVTYKVLASTPINLMLLTPSGSIAAPGLTNQAASSGDAMVIDFTSGTWDSTSGGYDNAQYEGAYLQGPYTVTWGRGNTYGATNGAYYSGPLPVYVSNSLYLTWVTMTAPPYRSTGQFRFDLVSFEIGLADATGRSVGTTQINVFGINGGANVPEADFTVPVSSALSPSMSMTRIVLPAGFTNLHDMGINVMKAVGAVAGDLFAVKVDNIVIRSKYFT